MYQRYLAIIVLASGCFEPEPEYSLGATINQDSFTSGTLTVAVMKQIGDSFPEVGGLPSAARVTVGGVEQVVPLELGSGKVAWRAADRSHPARATVCADSVKGEQCTTISLQVPEQTSSVSWSGDFDVLTELKVRRVKRVVRTEVWGEPDHEKWPSDDVAFEGQVLLEFGPGRSQSVDVIDGMALVRPTRDELLALAKSNTLKTRFVEDGIKTTWSETDFGWLQVMGDPELIDYTVRGTTSKAVVRNTTVDTMTVEVTSGYRDEGRWMHGVFKGTPYYGTTTLQLAPGEVKEATVSYPVPVLGGTLTRRPELVKR